MLRYSSSVTINRPPEAIFPYMTDTVRQGEWSDVQMKRLDGRTGDLVIGSRLQVSFGMGPMKANVGLEITEIEPNKRMAWTSFSGPIKWDGEYQLERTASGDGTVVSQAGTLKFTGLWRAMEPMAGAEISRGEVKELERLKAVVERE
jgi:uncharacterized protein YndB with AHSA1/START domain